jgi:hypothetical protein
MAKKAPGKGRNRITKKLTDKGVAKSQEAEGADMPLPARPQVPPPSSGQMENEWARIARQAADRRRKFAAMHSGEIKTPLPLRVAAERTVALLPGAGGLIADTVQTSPVKSPRAVGRSVRTNRIAIVLSVASLMVLIDDKLATLRDERPNARDAQAVRDEAIAHYENLKQDLEALRDVASHKRGKAKDRTVDKVANKFVQHVQNWWEKDHEQICGKAYNAAVFISCLSVCSLVGCGGATAVAVSGAIAGGKTVVDALKALPKRRLR